MYYLLIGGHGEGKVGELTEDFQGFIQEEKHEYGAEEGWDPKVELAGKYIEMQLWRSDEQLPFRIFRHESLSMNQALAELVSGYFEWMKKKHNRL